MEDKNFTIIEDIFDNNSNENSNLQKDYSFTRTADLNSARQPYPFSDIPSLSYDENMIKNKYNRQINPRVLASQYNSMSNTNRILQQQYVPNENKIIQKNVIEPVLNVPSQVSTPNNHLQISCKNIYDHIENCPICNKYYKQSNRTYILIIIFLVLIILLLLRQNKI